MLQWGSNRAVSLFGGRFLFKGREQSVLNHDQKAIVFSRSGCLPRDVEYFHTWGRSRITLMGVDGSRFPSQRLRVAARLKQICPQGSENV